MLLMIDNYDSFTYNLVQYFAELGQDVAVYRNDEISVEQVRVLSPEYIVIGPGPCSPVEAEGANAIIRTFAWGINVWGMSSVEKYYVRLLSCTAKRLLFFIQMKGCFMDYQIHFRWYVIIR